MLSCKHCCKAFRCEHDLCCLFTHLRAEMDGHVPSSLLLQLLSMLTGTLPSNLAASLMQANLIFAFWNSSCWRMTHQMFLL